MNENGHRSTRSQNEDEDGSRLVGANGHRRVVMNPTSGSGDHTDRIHALADEYGYDVVETSGPGDGTALAQAAVDDDIRRLAVAGGDGTLHEVVTGLLEADALGDVTVGILPVGTANIFARNVGVDDAEAGFNLLENGERRRIDLGMAGEEPFVVSTVAGLTAETSAATSASLKERIGSLAFLYTGIKKTMEFESLHLDVEAISQGEETTWTGEALCALVGNVRQFAKEGGQSNAEDGLFDVVIVEEMPPQNVVAEAAAHRVLGKGTEHVVHLRASQLTVEGLTNETVAYSLDGEVSEHEQLVLHSKPQALSVAVGPSYEANPDSA
ncbi:diacylglycerol kinase [Haloprofundus marisrubri]|uniref:Diacylglycerol kinase n=1 Tax=Haloprofundus marisrubri TaxID=1514971 RepID=A0A0W1R353_9EURY|nr:YegS/Rv2252/BmrU family lipid kinase [Haloprofundus marisrubri]KTG07626.1 diacylglycerol kinase [Haloprofundus marisrubri]